MSDIGSVADLIGLIIHTLKPSELERIKAAIRKREKELADDKAKLVKAIADGDVDAINALLFGD